MKKIVFRVSAAAVLAALAWGGFQLVKKLPDKARDVAVTTVRRGDVVVRAYSRGELRAVRSVTLTAPNLFGTVQVTRLAPLGSFAREGDLVIEFDDAEVLSRLEEKNLELEQIDERIKKAEADLAIQVNQDEVELLRARYSVRRAELEVQRNELLSEIDARKNTLNLKEANQRLDKLKTDIESRRKQAEAEILVLRENRRKAVLELQREQQRLQAVKVLAPMDGLVAIRQARTFFFFSGMQLPDIREGDQLRPGMPVADILDLSELEVVARVGELDRANLTEGQEAVIRLDALAQKPLRGKIKSLSGTASADVYSNDPAKKFDVVFEVDMRQLLEVLGASEERINRIMAQAERNRNRGVGQAASSSPMMLARFGGGEAGGGMARGGFAGIGGEAAGGGQSGLMMMGGGGGAGGEGGAARTGGRRPGGGNIDPSQLLSRLPEELKKEAQEILDKETGGKKWADLDDDKKRDAFRKLRPVLQKARESGQMGGPDGAPEAARGGGRFTEAQIKNARLPPPPEEDDQLDVLLRPGLLADVEIIVENIPNAVYVPVYAVFEKDNKPIVYVREGNRFVERQVKPSKRSETTMVIAEGLEEGEIVALADPYAKPSAGQREAPAAGGSGNPMQGLGGGNGGGGRR